MAPVVTPNWPSGQFTAQTPAPALLNCPHGQGALVPSPGHAEPAGQRVQLVRVVSVPPLVNQPTAHVPQATAPPALNLLPASQSVQVSLVAATAALKRPAAHAVQDEVAVAFCHLPAGQSAHALDPAVAENVPASQAVQVALAALICATGAWRPAAHGVPVHGRSPLLECVPATQAQLLQSLSRWPIWSWHVFDTQSTHVRAAVLESAEMLWPGPHVLCVMHAVGSRLSVWLVWYVLEPQLWHEPAANS
jgi:hypothetical protein